MTTRYYAEEPCEHGEMNCWVLIPLNDNLDPPTTRCPGGSRRELTIDYRAACWALVNSHAVDAVSEIGGLTLSDVILAVDAALSGDPQ